MLGLARNVIRPELRGGAGFDDPVDVPASTPARSSNWSAFTGRNPASLVALAECAVSRTLVAEGAASLTIRSPRRLLPLEVEEKYSPTPSLKSRAALAVHDAHHVASSTLLKWS